MEKLWGYCFAKRATAVFLVCVVLFFSCILRVGVYSMSDYAYVSAEQSTYRLTVGNVRGTVYDRNMVPLTNTESHLIAAVSPTPRAITAISAVLEGEALEGVLEGLKSGKPVLCEVPKPIDCDGIAVIKYFQTPATEAVAVHLIGYTDSDGHGAAGIQKAYDELLYSEAKAAFVYTVDGRGNILTGSTPEAESNSSVTAGGVVTTLDVNIQALVEREAEALEAGAIVVARNDTAEIAAMVSRPDFDASKLAEYLNAENSPLLNRALAAFNVGSVFKPCVAAAGLELGLKDFCYSCTGSCEIGDRVFNCHKRSGHGELGLKGGLANSCNTYFYNFARNAGCEVICKTARALGFGTSFEICNGIYSAAGSLPTAESLTSAAALANFSIGQGELLLSPTAMLTLYCAIAGDGSYYLPTAVLATVTDGRLKKEKKRAATRVMSRETAAALKEYLTAVITEGTGAEALPDTVTAAGKTATAQTGKYERGIEICEGWFCGFFPAEKPKYTVIVFSENTARQEKSCAEIFAALADGITELEN